MNKDNLLFAIIGLLAGLILGFLLTNSYNRRVLLSELQEQKQPLASQQTGDQQNPGAAVPQVAQAIENADQQPDNFEAQINAGEMFARIKNFEKAIQYFEKANKIKPDDYQTIVSLGNLNFDAATPVQENQPLDSAKLAKAQKWYEIALAKKNDDYLVRTDYGLTFFLGEPKDIDRAIKEYKASLAINPNHEQTLQNLAVAYSEKKDVEGLKETLAKLEKVNPNNKIIQRLKE
jgi:tetratricopeptide (TPR) repeat protein